MTANASAKEPRLEIIAHHDATSDFFPVHLTTTAAPACFAEGTNTVPRKDGGFDIIVDTTDDRYHQKAGRSVASTGLTQVQVFVDSPELKFDVVTATQFVVGMYSDALENGSLAVAFDLDEATLKAVRRNVSIITLARVFAHSPNNIYHTVDFVTTYYQKLEQAYNEAIAAAGITGGTLSFKLYTPEDDFFKENCIGLQTVGQSSAYAPCLGVIDFVGEGASASQVDIALVGKGIAFDTGGYDLKPSKFMETMHTDKSGLVYVAAATVLAAAMGVHKHVRCYLPCAENRISANAMVPGDIITYPNGVKVEIGNTDAEGRLILADGLLLASKDQPKYILDAATLTGAAKIAIGRDMCAVLNRNNCMDEQMAEAFAYTKEEYWVLPLREYHKRYITARRAQICNTSHGDGAPGASTAAAFLSFFVDPKIKWTHLDLANAFHKDSSPYYGTGSTGATVYALAHWLVGAEY